MEDTPSAPTPAPAEASVAPEQTPNAEPTKAPEQPAVDLGLTGDQAQQFKNFIDNNGGFDKAFSKLKADVSTPKSAQAEVVQEPSTSEPKKEEPTSHTEPTEQYTPPRGAITAQEFIAEQYFKSLAKEEKYATIAKGIEDGEYLKEMSAFGIQALNPDGSINDNKVRMYLNLKAQTVPAKPTETEPSASNAPTVQYTEVGDKITSAEQAAKVLTEPGHPKQALAEEFFKTALNKGSQPKK